MIVVQRMIVLFVLPLMAALPGGSVASLHVAQASYPNATIADKALTYVGQWGGNACRDAHRSGLTGSTTVYPVRASKVKPNGTIDPNYGGDGQCRAFVNCIVWMASNRTQWLGGKPDGTYFGAFLAAGGQEIKSVADLAKGDIVQSGNGVHTWIVVRRISGNIFNVVDSNHDYKETVLNYNRAITLTPSIRAFRMGTIKPSRPAHSRTGDVLLVSATSAGTPGNDNSGWLPAFLGEPAWSPVEAKVAFLSNATNFGVRNRDSNGWFVTHLFVKDLRTHALSLVDVTRGGTPGNSHVSEFAWSPDGTKIAFKGGRNLTSHKQFGLPEILVKDLQSGAVSSLSGTDGGSSFVWSPDGTKIAFTAYRGGRGEQLLVKDLRSGSVKVVSTTRSGELGNGSSWQAAWSPDSTQIAFASTARNLGAAGLPANKKADIFVKNLVSGRLRLISTVRRNEPMANFVTPSWSPDGTKLMFDALYEPTSAHHDHIYISDLRSGTVSRLDAGFSDSADIRDGRWSPDGGRIVFNVYRRFGGLHVFVKNLRNGNLQLVSSTANGSPADGYCLNHGWSADGTMILMTCDATNLVKQVPFATTQVYVKIVGK